MLWNREDHASNRKDRGTQSVDAMLIHAIHLFKCKICFNDYIYSLSRMERRWGCSAPAKRFSFKFRYAVKNDDSLILISFRDTHFLYIK